MRAMRICVCFRAARVPTSLRSRTRAAPTPMPRPNQPVRAHAAKATEHAYTTSSSSSSSSSSSTVEFILPLAFAARAEISGWLTRLTSAITPARRRALVTMIGAPDRSPWSARVCGRRVQLDSRRQRQLPDRCLDRCCLAGSGPVPHATRPSGHMCVRTMPTSHSRILAVEHRLRCARIGADRLVRRGRSCATRRRRRRSSP